MPKTLVNGDLVTVAPPYRITVPFVPPPPPRVPVLAEDGTPMTDADGNPLMKDGDPVVVIDPETGLEKTTDYITYPTAIANDWSDEQLAALDLYRLYDDPVPDGHQRTGGESREFRNRLAWRTFESQPVPASRDYITADAEGRLMETTSVELSDGRIVPVHTREPNDLIRITAIAVNALLMRSQSRDLSIRFRGADEVEYLMDTAQQLELAAKVFLHQQVLIRASHKAKDRFEAGEIPNRVDISAALDSAIVEARQELGL